MAPPCDPGTFSGTDDSDVDDWIILYERVSNYNRWDPTLMLANVIFYLNGTARVCYETHEEELTSWDTFKEKLKTLFGRPDDRQLAAKKQLATRAQSSTESYVAYIQDILALCHKVDASMSETDKVGHVLKGIADDAFHLLVCKDCTSIDSIMNECRRFEQVKGRRISPSFSRLPNTAATSSCEFKNFADVFGRPAVRKLRADQRLRARAQLHGENFTSYIEVVVYLCRRVDSSMPERAKIDHIVHGIDDDAFRMLLAKSSNRRRRPCPMPKL
ncbi:uncharacterized protein LOC144097970 [Amblyomma americanum]